MFTVKGKIHYEPMRNFSDNSRNKWWLTAEVRAFEEISRYYRWFIDREWYAHDRIKTYKIDYYRPSHPFHVSIARGERPLKNVDQWGKYMKNHTVNIKYGFPRQIINPPNAKGLFWVCDAHFDEYNELREYFGLPTEKDGRKFYGHITMARAFSV